jgi:hypothetical protein
MHLLLLVLTRVALVLARRFSSRVFVPGGTANLLT